MVQQVQFTLQSLLFRLDTGLLSVWSFCAGSPHVCVGLPGVLSVEPRGLEGGV